jgi:hypothetical protein
VPVAFGLTVIDHDRVQGKSRPDRVLLDAQALVGHLVPAGSVYAFLAEHRTVVFWGAPRFPDSYLMA